MTKHNLLTALMAGTILGCGPLDDAGPVAAQGRAIAAAPVILLPFSEDDGDIAFDRSGRDNHGRLRGAQRVRDQMGRALRFDGRNDYVNVPESRELNITGPLTISVWVKTTDPISGEAPTQREILFRGQSNIVFGFEKEAVEGITWLRCYIRHSLDPYEYREVAINDDSHRVRDGRWHHVAVVFIPRRHMTLYLDGEQVARRTHSMPSIMLADSGNYYSIGARRRGDGTIDRALSGLIDDVRLYPVALDGDDVAGLYQARIGGAED